MWLLASLAALACSSTSTSRATDACSPGEITSCELTTGCVARKTCNSDGKSYSPCQCVGDAGSPGGSSGAGGTAGGGSGGSSGSGGNVGSSGALGSAGTIGSGGTSGAVGAGGTDSTGGTGGSAAGMSGTGGSGAGTDGSGGTSGGCLRCLEAFDRPGVLDDAQLCAASRPRYIALVECVCSMSSMCAQLCRPHCIDPANNPFTQACRDCMLPICNDQSIACINDLGTP